jgi:hypothetical protein
MVPMSRQPQDMRPTGQGRNGPGGAPGGDTMMRWVIAIIVVVLVLIVFGPSIVSRNNAQEISFSTFLNKKVPAHQVATANFQNTTGTITGKLTDGTSYTTPGPATLPVSYQQAITQSGAKLTFSNPSSNTFQVVLIYLLPVVLIMAKARCRGSCRSVVRAPRSIRPSDRGRRLGTSPATPG